MEKIKVGLDIAKKAIEYYRYFRPYALANRNADHINNGTNIHVFSSPRSGSTWVGEILSKLPDSFLVWEPMYFDPPYPELKKSGLYWDVHIPEQEEWPAAESFFRQLFNREIASLKALRLYYTNDLKRSGDTRYFIFKDVDSNMLIPWLTRKFPLKAVYIIRHPCAVVASQMKYGFWDHLIADPQLPYYGADCRYTSIYEHYKDILAKVRRPEERLAALWALHNVVPIKHPENNLRWITVSYERLYADPQTEVPRIFSRLNLSIPKTALKDVLTPSTTSIKSSVSNITSGFQLQSWRKSLSNEQVNNILNIVNAFGIDMYDTSDEPDYTKLFSSEPHNIEK